MGGRGRWLRNAAGVVAGALFAVAAPLTITKGNRIYGGNATLIALWSAAGIAAFVWALSTDFVRKWVRVEFGRRVEPRPPQWIERLPYYLNPANSRMWCANHLIEYGNAVLTQIPRKDYSPLVQAMASRGPVMRDHFRAVAYWEFDVKTFLDARAPECRALFQTRAHLPQGSYLALRDYVKSRVEELKAIHGRLAD